MGEHSKDQYQDGDEFEHIQTVTLPISTIMLGNFPTGNLALRVVKPKPLWQVPICSPELRLPHCRMRPDKVSGGPLSSALDAPTQRR
jgi:hypothetical protein